MLQHLTAKKSEAEAEDCRRGEADALEVDHSLLEWDTLVEAAELHEAEQHGRHGLEGDERFDQTVAHFATEVIGDDLGLFDGNCSTAYRRGFVAGLAKLEARADGT